MAKNHLWMKLVIVQSLVGTSLRFPESVSFISVSFFSAFLSVFASLCLSLPLSLSHYFSASVISFFLTHTQAEPILYPTWEHH